MNTRICIASCLLGLSLLVPAIAVAQDVGKRKNLGGKNFQNRDLRQENLDGANLENANLTAVNLTDAVLQKANLRDANLSRARLGGADLTGADLRNANLELAGMQGANLSQANLEGLDLKGVSLFQCNLRGANLKNAKGFSDIRRADLRDADLRGAYLLGISAFYSENVNLRGAKYDKNTRWPKGFDIEGSGAKIDESAAEPAKKTPGKDTPPAKKKKKGKTEPKNSKTGVPAKQDDAAKPATAKALDPNRPAAAPTEDEVKKAFEKQWTATQVAKNTFFYSSMKFGPAREGDALQDGTPAAVKTIVYPVTLKCEQVVEYNDGTTKSTVRTQTFKFFKAETGGWTSTSYLER